MPEYDKGLFSGFCVKENRYRQLQEPLTCSAVRRNRKVPKAVWMDATIPGFGYRWLRVMGQQIFGHTYKP